MMQENEKTLQELTTEIEVMVRAFKLPYKVMQFSKLLPPFFVLVDFGIIIAGINYSDQSDMSTRFSTRFPGYKVLYIYINDKLTDKRYKVLWELMRAGYMHFLRTNFSATVHTILDREGLARRIIKERLRIWGDSPKYTYLIALNKDALEHTVG